MPPKVKIPKEAIIEKAFELTKVYGFEKVTARLLAEANFIPPASPANKKTWGVLTVNNHMKICTSNLITER